MMDGEEVYRARLEACLAAATASSLPQVREKHMTAAASWLALLEFERERKRGTVAIPDAEDAAEGSVANV